jgi:hypothetical protein
LVTLKKVVEAVRNFANARHAEQSGEQKGGQPKGRKRCKKKPQLQ